MLAVIGTNDQIVRARFTAGSEDGDLGAGERVPPLPLTVDEDAAAQTFIRQARSIT